MARGLAGVQLIMGVLVIGAIATAALLPRPPRSAEAARSGYQPDLALWRAYTDAARYLPGYDQAVSNPDEAIRRLTLLERRDPENAFRWYLLAAAQAAL